jgi:ABC-type lipoprotein export system ATPase subunit
MAKEIKALYFDTLKIPLSGWVLWRGDKEEVNQIFRQILLLDPTTKVKMNDTLMTEWQDNLHLGLSFEWGGLMSNKTLEENILLPLEYHNQSTVEAKQRMQQVFADLGYEKYLQKRPFYVPRNVQKMTSILRVFLQGSQTIFLHNLSFGLENQDKIYLKKFLQDYRHLNLHFSEGAIHSETEFTEILTIEPLEPAV